MHEPNFEAKPLFIGGKKAWWMGLNADGENLYKTEDGYAVLRGGEYFHAKKIGAGGRLAPEEKGKPEKKGKRADGNHT